MICEMVKANILLILDLSIKENTKTTKKMAWGVYSSLMETFT